MHARPRSTAELAARLGVDDLGRTAVRRLSSGQRQRLAVACALVGRPEVLVMDEPTAALDPEGRRAVLGLVAEAAADGCAVLWSSHTLLDVERAADRVVVLAGGRVLADGPPDRVTGEEVVRFEAPPGSPLHDLRAALGAGADLSEPAPGHVRAARQPRPAGAGEHRLVAGGQRRARRHHPRPAEPRGARPAPRRRAAAAADAGAAGAGGPR